MLVVIISSDESDAAQTAASGPDSDSDDGDAEIVSQPARFSPAQARTPALSTSQASARAATTPTASDSERKPSLRAGAGSSAPTSAQAMLHQQQQQQQQQRYDFVQASTSNLASKPAPTPAKAQGKAPLATTVPNVAPVAAATTSAPASKSIPAPASSTEAAPVVAPAQSSSRAHAPAARSTAALIEEIFGTDGSHHRQRSRSVRSEHLGSSHGRSSTTPGDELLENLCGESSTEERVPRTSAANVAAAEQQSKTLTTPCAASATTTTPVTEEDKSATQRAASVHPASDPQISGYDSRMTGDKASSLLIRVPASAASATAAAAAIARTPTRMLSPSHPGTGTSASALSPLSQLSASPRAPSFASASYAAHMSTMDIDRPAAAGPSQGQLSSDDYDDGGGTVASSPIHKDHKTNKRSTKKPSANGSSGDRARKRPRLSEQASNASAPSAALVVNGRFRGSAEDADAIGASMAVTVVRHQSVARVKVCTLASPRLLEVLMGSTRRMRSSARSSWRYPRSATILRAPTRCASPCRRPPGQHVSFCIYMWADQELSQDAWILRALRHRAPAHGVLLRALSPHTGWRDGIALPLGGHVQL